MATLQCKNTKQSLQIHTATLSLFQKEQGQDQQTQTLQTRQQQRHRRVGVVQVGDTTQTTLAGYGQVWIEKIGLYDHETTRVDDSPASTDQDHGGTLGLSRVDSSGGGHRPVGLYVSGRRGHDGILEARGKWSDFVG